MRKVAICLLVAALSLLPTFSDAGSGHGGHGGGGGGGHGFHGNGFHGHGFHGHGFHGRGFVVAGSGCCWGPWWWGYPAYYYPPPAYYAPAYYYPPAYYGPSPSYGPPVGYGPPTATVSVAPAQRTPNVVQFATGRYELRGDGTSMPYRWVWIPNPPTAPPAAPASSQPVASAR